MDNPRAILSSLERKYGTRPPEEKEQATLKWRAPWNPQESIESIFFNIEELFVRAVIACISYTQAQLLDQALDKVLHSGFCGVERLRNQQQNVE